MTELTTLDGDSPFDHIQQTRPDGTDFWSARDLLPLMGYARWQNFEIPLNRAIQSAENTGMDVTSNFLRSRKVSGARGPAQDDYELSREAAYLVAMNGDPNKPEVAAAQAYFARRTVQAETAEANLAGMSDWVRQQMATLMQIGKVEVEQRQQANRLREVTARVDSIEGAHDWFSALAYARLNEFPTERTYLQRVGMRASQILREDGGSPGKTQHPAFGTVNTYPVWVLERAFVDVPMREEWT